MEKIITLETEIVPDKKLVIEGSPEVEIDASKSITAEIAPDTYVLGSVGSFDTASSWVGTYVNELVRESIGTGGTLADALELIRTDVMDEIETGVNQVITQVENEYVSNSTLATTLASEIGASRSAILDVVQTYADATSANTTAINGLKASLGGDSSSSAIEAFIGSIAIAKVDAESATAATQETLIATFNDTSARIDSVSEVAVTASGWAASASKLITASDGSITGWEFADGSDSESTFKIKAQNFEISNGVSGYSPFSIVGSNVRFDGLVEFSNVSGSPTYTEGYGVPTSTSQPVTSVYLNKSDNSTYTYTARGWIPGGDPDAITAEDLGPRGTTTIDGGRIDTDSLFAQDITYTGKITGGSGGFGGIIQSRNYVTSGGTQGMKIDLVNGSIYIA